MKRALCLMLLFLLSCQYVPMAPRKGEIEIPEVHTGTDALEVDFMPGAPPEEIFEEGQFDISVDIQNLGAFDVENGLYNLVLEPNLRLAQPGKRTGSYSIEGRSPYNPVGGRKRLTFRTHTEPLPEMTERFPSTIIFNTCYAYKTEATGTVCIDTTPGEQAGEPCQVQTLYLGGGQGGPVAVTRIEPKMTPYDDAILPVFAIYLDNLGNGQVVDTAAIGGACGAPGPSFGPAAFNRVRIRASMPGLPLFCRPEEIKLSTEGDTRILCEAFEPLFERGTYTSPLTIEIDYGYVTSIATTTTIVRPG